MTTKYMHHQIARGNTTFVQLVAMKKEKMSLYKIDKIDNFRNISLTRTGYLFGEFCICKWWSRCDFIEPTSENLKWIKTWPKGKTQVWQPAAVVSADTLSAWPRVLDVTDKTSKTGASSTGQRNLHWEGYWYGSDQFRRSRWLSSCFSVGILTFNEVDTGYRPLQPATSRWLRRSEEIGMIHSVNKQKHSNK